MLEYQKRGHDLNQKQQDENILPVVEKNDDSDDEEELHNKDRNKIEVCKVKLAAWNVMWNNNFAH